MRGSLRLAANARDSGIRGRVKAARGALAALGVLLAIWGILAAVGYFMDAFPPPGGARDTVDAGVASADDGGVRDAGRARAATPADAGARAATAPADAGSAATHVAAVTPTDAGATAATAPEDAG